MNAELQGYGDQLLSIRQDATGLMSGVSDAQFNWQPAPGRWSMAGCFDHLNKSAADMFLPVIDKAIAHARANGMKNNGPFAYPALERWAIKNNDAPAKMKFKAPNKFQPAPALPVEQVRADFLRLQDELLKRMHDADGLDLQRAKQVWPFWPLKFTLGGLMLMMMSHERRHIHQAREVRQNPGFPSS
jgi:hypothetical protein